MGYIGHWSVRRLFVVTLVSLSFTPIEGGKWTTRGEIAFELKACNKPVPSRNIHNPLVIAGPNSCQHAPAKSDSS